MNKEPPKYKNRIKTILSILFGREEEFYDKTVPENSGRTGSYNLLTKAQSKKRFGLEFELQVRLQKAIPFRIVLYSYGNPGNKHYMWPWLSAIVRETKFENCVVERAESKNESEEGIVLAKEFNIDNWNSLRKPDNSKRTEINNWYADLVGFLDQKQKEEAISEQIEDFNNSDDPQRVQERNDYIARTFQTDQTGKTLGHNAGQDDNEADKIRQLFQDWIPKQINDKTGRYYSPRTAQDYAGALKFASSHPEVPDFYQITDPNEFSATRKSLESIMDSDDFKRTGKYNANSVLSSALDIYGRFLNDPEVQKKVSSISSDKATPSPTSFRNLIYFGAPGTGKSFKLKQDVVKAFANRYERVTFYPTYSYAQFVGCYKPVMKPADNKGNGNKPKSAVLSEDELAKKLSEVYENASKSADENVVASIVLFGEQYIDSFNNGTTVASVWRKSGIKSKMSGYLNAAIGAANLYQKLKEETCGGKEEIAYKFVPGPFLRVLVDALNNPGKDHCLVIEEINRANAAAVFGDVFQLLDRATKDSEDGSVKRGESEYEIAASEDVKKFLYEDKDGLTEAGKIKLENLAGKGRLRIPSNMYIWATMNSADQGVFPMDTAFKRRWTFKYFQIDESNEDVKNRIIGTNSTYQWTGNDSMKRWNNVRKFVNRLLSLFKVNEDKLMGPWFVQPESGNEISAEQFESKVLMYLWEDAARMCRQKMFPNSVTSYSELITEWRKHGVGIFKHLMGENQIGGKDKNTDNSATKLWGALDMPKQQQ